MDQSAWPGLAVVSAVVGLIAAPPVEAEILSFDIPEPALISEWGTSQVTLSSFAAPSIASVKLVRVTLAHEWLGDLTLKLVPPSGPAIILFDRVGAAPDGSPAILGNYVPDEDSGKYLLSPELYQFAVSGADFAAQAQLATDTLNPPVVSPDQVYAGQVWASGRFGAGVWQLIVSDGADLGGGEVIAAEFEYTPAGEAVAPTLTWVAPGDIVYGSPLSAAQLNAVATANGSAVPGVFSYSPPAGTVLSAGAGQLLSVTFTPEDPAAFTSVTGSVRINVNPAPLVVSVDDKTMTYGGGLPALSAHYSGFVNSDTAASLSPPVSLTTIASSSSGVGTYAIRATGGANPNYVLTFSDGTLTVLPAPLTITADNLTKDYGAPLPPLTASYAGFVNGDTPSVLSQPVVLATTATANSPVGAYPITITGGVSANYSITLINGTLTVAAPGAITPTLTWSTPADVVYGNALSVAELNAVATAEGAPVAGVFSYSPALGTVLPAGDGQLLSVTFTPQDSVRFLPATATVRINIKPALLTVNVQDKTTTYGGELPSWTANYIGFVNGDSLANVTDPVVFTCPASSGSGVGTYPIRATGGASPNYTIRVNEGKLTILPAPLTITADNQSKAYAAPLPVLTATYTGFVNGDTPVSLAQPVTLTTTATVSSPVGAYPIAVAGGSSPNYTITRNSGTLTITKAVLTITADDRTKVYGAPMPILTASYAGFLDGDGPASLAQPVVLTTTATVSSSVGTYAIKVSGGTSTNYTVVLKDGSLTVTKARLTVLAENKSKAYGAPLPPLTASYLGWVGTDSATSLAQPVALTTPATAATAVGSYPIIASGGVSPNYILVYSNATLSVTKAQLVVTANNKSKTYGAPLPGLTASYSGLVNGDTPESLSSPVSLSTTATASSRVGTYPVALTGGASPNYTLVLNSGILTVTKAPLTISADNKSKAFGAPLPTLTANYSGFVNGDGPASLTQPVTLTTGATATSPIGTYTINVAGGANANYTILYSKGTLTVTKGLVRITPDNKTKVYGAPLPTLTASYSGFANNDTVAVLTQPVTLSTTATATSPVGTYPISITGGASSNYTLTFETGTLTVTKATLVITADDKTKTYGAPLPSLTASYSGFASNDSPASLSQPVSFLLTAGADSGVGEYPITLLGGASPNYEIVRRNGRLSVTKAVLTVTAEDKTKPYGAPLPNLTAAYSGFVNGDSPARLSQPVSLFTTAKAASPAGSYPITITGGSSANYAFKYKGGRLTVTKALLTVAADDKSKVYGARLPVFTGTYSGFVNGETTTSLTQQPTFTTTATAGSAAGAYEIKPLGGAAQNYTLVPRNGTLTITKAPLIVTADDKIKPYGAPLPAFTATCTGFVNGDTVLEVSPSLTFTMAVTASSPVGTYPIGVRGGVSPNYNLEFRPGTLTVARAQLTVTADDKTKVYGAPVPTLTGTYSGFVNGDTIQSLARPVVFTTMVTPGSPAGLYQIRASGGSASNYNLVLNNGTFTVAKAPLTIAANDCAKLYGAAVPVLTASYSGFVNGETTLSLTGRVSLTTTATLKSPIGQYPIFVSGVQSPNYAITFVNGTLRVVPPNQSVKLDPAQLKTDPGAPMSIRAAVADGTKVRLEWSEDLETWHEVATQIATNGRINFDVDRPAEAALRFFRAVLPDN